MKFLKFYCRQFVTAIMVLQPGIVLADTVAYPESRIGSPGYEWKTITARRKGPEDYSSKIIGTPIHIKAGQVVQSVWFLTRVVDEDTGQVIAPASALTPAVIRAGIATEAGFRANPLANLARDFSNNLAYNAGVGTHPFNFSTAERRKLLTTTIPDLPGFILIGVELNQLWQADRDQTVYAWVNIEYSYEPYLAQVFQYEDETGPDLHVYQSGEVYPLDQTSMIWLEYGDPFLYSPVFAVEALGSKREVVTSEDQLKQHKLFAKRPFRFDVDGTGGNAANQNLTLHASIQGTACPLPITTLRTNSAGRAAIEGSAPGAPRRRVRLQLELRRGSEVVAQEAVKLIRPGFHKTGRLGRRATQRLCDKLSLL